MTVRELVVALTAMDQDLQVIVTTTCHGCYGDNLTVKLDPAGDPFPGRVEIEGGR